MSLDAPDQRLTASRAPARTLELETSRCSTLHFFSVLHASSLPVSRVSREFALSSWDNRIDPFRIGETRINPFDLGGTREKTLDAIVSSAVVTLKKHVPY